MIRVLLADDHALVRAGLQQLLAAVPDIDVVGAATDGDEAVDLAAALAPDVVLMDLSMPRVDGVEATRRILAQAPDAQVVVLTSFVERERVVGALDAGAVGYLLKDGDPQDVVRGIRAVARGESPLDPKAARALLTTRAARPTVEMTEREREVLALLAAGLANKQIGRRLGITEATVKAHLTRVYAAIGVTDRTSAAVWAHRNGVA
ncbi:response regulator [Motilibacter deserti]|uniref:Response regulator transcription factor n=1 Tax=Motilibacter deserti TaxID=2714956 RepID=A0ABX0GRZ7_9ACTN|nr:response regulator transcription factor [Motilibacter deserti]